LAVALLIRHGAREDLADLNAAITRLEQAERAFPPGSVDQARCRMNLAIGLAQRYTARRDLADLRAAITRLEQAERMFLPGSVEQARCQTDLAHMLRLRYLARGKPSDARTARRAACLAVRTARHLDAPMLEIDAQRERAWVLAALGATRRVYRAARAG